MSTNFSKTRAALLAYDNLVDELASNRVSVSEACRRVGELDPAIARIMRAFAIETDQDPTYLSSVLREGHIPRIRQMLAKNSSQVSEERSNTDDEEFCEGALV